MSLLAHGCNRVTCTCVGTDATTSEIQSQGRGRERETPCLCGSDYGFSEQHRRGKFTASGIACVFDYTPATAARARYNFNYKGQRVTANTARG